MSMVRSSPVPNSPEWGVEERIICVIIGRTPSIIEERIPVEWIIKIADSETYCDRRIVISVKSSVIRVGIAVHIRIIIVITIARILIRIGIIAVTFVIVGTVIGIPVAVVSYSQAGIAPCEKYTA
jgi:hypothetical protein